MSRFSRLSFQGSLLKLYGLGVLIPYLVATAAIVWSSLPSGIAMLVWVLLTLWCALIARMLYLRAVSPLQGLANLLESLRMGDSNVRGREMGRDDVLSEVYHEANQLADHMRSERLADREASGLLLKVMELVDVAVLTFDQDQRLIQSNAAASRLLQAAGPRLDRAPASKMGLSEFLKPGLTRNVAGLFGSTDRFRVRCVGFRSHGRPAMLLTLTDLSQSLREEERRAWKRLIRVLGHEINNAIVPIVSIGQSLLEMSNSPDANFDVAADRIARMNERAESLRRFVRRLSDFAKLPPARRRLARVADLVSTLNSPAVPGAALKITIAGGPDLRVSLDIDQMRQVMDNLVQNAADAGSAEAIIEWRQERDDLVIQVTDDGSGFSAQDNLFTPFFSTKPGGSGIGLLISRQVAESHGGTFELVNRDDAAGCVARVRVPLR